MIINNSKIYELDSTIDNISIIKNKVIADISIKMNCQHNFEYKNIILDLDLALDEVLMNIIDHSDNGRGKFKITYSVTDDKIDIIVSDCSTIDINDKSVKIKPVKEDVLVNIRSKKDGGMGLFTVRHVVDNLGIFKVFKNGNKKPSGMIVAITKAIPVSCKDSIGVYA